MSVLSVAFVIALLAAVCFLSACTRNGHGPEAGFAGMFLVLAGMVLLLVAAFLATAAVF